MSDLDVRERRSLEELFDMGSGYVLRLSNRTFSDFVIDSIGIDVSHGAYGEQAGWSKAKRLREIWRQEPNHVVAKLLTDLIGLAALDSTERDNSVLVQACQRTPERLLEGAAVQGL